MYSFADGDSNVAITFSVAAATPPSPRMFYSFLKKEQKKREEKTRNKNNTEEEKREEEEEGSDSYVFLFAVVPVLAVNYNVAPGWKYVQVIPKTLVSSLFLPPTPLIIYSSLSLSLFLSLSPSPCSPLSLSPLYSFSFNYSFINRLLIQVPISGTPTGCGMWMYLSILKKNKGGRGGERRGETRRDERRGEGRGGEGDSGEILL